MSSEPDTDVGPGLRATDEPGLQPRTRISSVSLSQVWQKRQGTLSQAPIPVTPATVVIQTVSPEIPFLSVTVTLTPGDKLTFDLF